MKRYSRDRFTRVGVLPDRASGSRERLAFSYGSSVPGRGHVDAALARGAEPTFATAAIAEPRDWGYIGLLAFTAVLLLRPQDQLPGLSPLHLAEMCAFVGIIPMVVHRFAQRLPVFRVTPETTGLIAFGVVMLATAPFSIWPGGALEEFTDSYLKALVVFVLMMNTLTTPRRLERLTWLIILCMGYVAALGVANYARGVHLVENGRLNGPLNGIYGNPNDLALTMVTFMPAAAVIALSPTFSTARRLMASVIVALMMATIVFTKSRGGLLGLVAMLLALVVLGRKVRPGFGIAVVVTVLIASPFMPASFWSRMSSIVDDQQDQREFTGSREARRVVMQEGINTFVERPLTGVGAGQFKNYNPPGRKERWRETHNALIQVASETGLFGLLTFSFLILSAAVAAFATRKMLSRPRQRGAPDPMAAALSPRDRHALYVHTVAMTAGLVGWFTCAMFASVAYSWTFYYLLALIVAPRELARDRMALATAVSSARAAKPFSVPAAARRMAPGMA